MERTETETLWPCDTPRMTTPLSRPAGLMPLVSAERAATPGVGRLEEPRVCWTQLLRETVTEIGGAPPPLGSVPCLADIEQLFAQIEEVLGNQGRSSA